MKKYVLILMICVLCLWAASCGAEMDNSTESDSAVSDVSSAVSEDDSVSEIPSEDVPDESSEGDEQPVEPSDDPVSQLTNASTFEGWDFSGVWKMGSKGPELRKTGN